MKIIVLFYRKRRRSLWAEVSRPMWKEPVKRCRSKPDIKLSSEGTRHCRWAVRLTHLVAQSNKHKCTNANAASTQRHTQGHAGHLPEPLGAGGTLSTLSPRLSFLCVAFSLLYLSHSIILCLQRHFLWWVFTETLKTGNVIAAGQLLQGLRVTGELWVAENEDTMMSEMIQRLQDDLRTTSRRGHESLSRRTVVINEVITGHVTALL